MFAANTYVIRLATESDRHALRRLAELDSRRSLSGRILIGEIGAEPAAAISLQDGRIVADPFQRTGTLSGLLRLRYQSLRAVAQTPSLRDRMLAGVRIQPRVATAPSEA